MVIENRADNYENLIDQEYSLLTGDETKNDLDVPMDPTIGKTSFWRNSRIISHVIPNLVTLFEDNSPILELACSTGRETYSIATELLHKGYANPVIAVDPDPNRVQFATKGTYGLQPGRVSTEVVKLFEVAKVDRSLKDRCLVEEIDRSDHGWKGGIIQFTDRVKDNIMFVNGDESIFSSDSNLAIITANNLLEHFTQARKKNFLVKIASMLKEDGYFLCEGVKSNQRELWTHYNEMQNPDFLKEVGLEMVEGNLGNMRTWALIYKKYVDRN